MTTEATSTVDKYFALVTEINEKASKLGMRNVSAYLLAGQIMQLDQTNNLTQVLSDRLERTNLQLDALYHAIEKRI